VVHVPTAVSLCVIAMLLVTGVLTSLWATRRRAPTRPVVVALEIRRTPLSGGG
jgi:hypothetical protein